MDGCIGEDGVWVRDGLEKAGVDVGRVRVVDGEVSDSRMRILMRTWVPSKRLRFRGFPGLGDRLLDEPSSSPLQMGRIVSVSCV